jgi:Tfp pilus assembly protein PilV
MNVIEVLLASAIFAVMLVPMMGLFQLGNRFSLEGEQELKANLFALGLLEQLRHDMDDWTEGATREVPIPRIPFKAPEGYQYRVERDRIDTALEKFSVIVTWKQGKRSREKERSLTLTTVISRAPCISTQAHRPSRRGYE